LLIAIGLSHWNTGNIAALIVVDLKAYGISYQKNISFPELTVANTLPTTLFLRASENMDATIPKAKET
jgi:hypothetical protein